MTENTNEKNKMMKPSGPFNHDDNERDDMPSLIEDTTRYLVYGHYVGNTHEGKRIAECKRRLKEDLVEYAADGSEVFRSTTGITPEVGEVLLALYNAQFDSTSVQVDRMILMEQPECHYGGRGIGMVTKPSSVDEMLGVESQLRPRSLQDFLTAYLLAVEDVKRAEDK